MRYSKLLKSRLNDVIVDASMSSEFKRNPKTDFTRTRKLDFITTFNSILTMGGGTLNKEILSQFNFSLKKPSKSAVVQARNKILPEAFSHVFYQFTSSLRRPNRYREYNLMAVDGTRINIYRNPNDDETYVANKTHKGHNSFVLTAMYDLMNSIFLDGVVQPTNYHSEREALIDMLPSVPNKSIIVIDRGYECYNLCAHFDNINSNYVMRVKDIGSNGILSKLNLPDSEFDKEITVHVSNFQRKALKKLENFRYSPDVARFDFSNEENPVCKITFRVIRTLLDNGKYQCVITNLSSNFTFDDIVHLYKLRWGIETAFRQLKYASGLANLHAKKKDSIIQEIFARLTFHNFCESVVQNTIYFNRDTTHNYKIDFTETVHTCRQFLRIFNTILINVEDLISSYLSVIRDNRSFERNLTTKKFTSFTYRVS